MRKILSTLLIAALLLAPVVTATVMARPALVEVGGLTLYWMSSGDSAATAADVTIAFPTGFLPDYCEFVDDHDATAPDKYMWQKSMANNTSIFTNGADGVIAYTSTAGSGCGFDFTTTAGSVIVDVNCQVNSGDYLLRCVRFSQ